MVFIKLKIIVLILYFAYSNLHFVLLKSTIEKEKKQSLILGSWPGTHSQTVAISLTVTNVTEHQYQTRPLCEHDESKKQ
jgi:hypothetical protein